MIPNINLDGYNFFSVATIYLLLFHFFLRDDQIRTSIVIYVFFADSFRDKSKLAWIEADGDA